MFIWRYSRYASSGQASRWRRRWLKKQNAAAKFVAHLDKAPLLSYTDGLYDLDTFRRAFGVVCLPILPSTSSATKLEKPSPHQDGNEARLSKKDVEVLVKWLMRDMGVVVSDGAVSLVR